LQRGIFIASQVFGRGNITVQRETPGTSIERTIYPRESISSFSGVLQIAILVVCLAKERYDLVNGRSTQLGRVSV